MNVSKFERETLAALRSREFYLRWGKSIPQGILSPIGGRVARDIAWVHTQRNGNKTPVSAEEILAADKREGEPSPELLELVDAICTQATPTLSVELGLANEAAQRAALQAMLQAGTQQLSAGRVDLEALAMELRKYRPGVDAVLAFNAQAIFDDQAKLAVLPTPWGPINDNLEGGIRIKELGMVMATPKAGKTAMLLNLSAKALAVAWNVLYITAADINYSGIGVRLCGIFMGQSTTLVRRDLAILKRFEAELEARKVRFMVADYTYRPCSMLNIERDIDQIRSELGDNKLLVVIDRLEEAIPHDKSGDLRRDISNNFLYARALASRYAVPMWVDSQASLNEGDQGWVDLTRGAESRIGKAKVVDLCLGVGTHPDDDHTLRVTIAGRRQINERRHELQREPASGQINV